VYSNGLKGILLAILAVSQHDAFLLAQDYESADVSYDSVQGLYHINYWDLTEADQDTLVYGTVLSGKAADPRLDAQVVQGSAL